jgi:hypothetical protein
VVEVALTAKGSSRVRQVIDARRVDMDRILACFDDGQLIQFEQMLQLFLRGVRAAQAPEDRIEQSLEG